MKIINQIIRGLDGEPLVERSSRPDIDPLPMTVASTLCHVALQPPAEGQPPYSADHSVERLEFAMAAHRAAPFGPFDISKDMVKALRKDIPRFFAPLLAGQLLLVLDGKELPISPDGHAGKSQGPIGLPDGRVEPRGGGLPDNIPLNHII